MADIETVNEGTSCVVEVAFTDEDGAAVVPTAATYRIDCASTGTAILASTAISSLAAEVSVLVTGTQNRIVGANGFERRVLTVEYSYGVGKAGKEEYEFLVKNLRYVT